MQQATGGLNPFHHSKVNVNIHPVYLCFQDLVGKIFNIPKTLNSVRCSVTFDLIPSDISVIR